MRYLVSGGIGFLGTNLCLRLLGEGHEVVALDDLSTSFPPNLALLRAKRGFSFIKHDIVEPIPDIGGFDFIYNLACPASPARYEKDPMKTFRTSVWGVWNMLGFAKKDRTPIFHSSTSEVYGDPLIHPQEEGYWGNSNPIGARSCYDEGKRAAETLLFDFHRKTDHPIKVARIFNTYGPKMDPEDGRVVSSFIVRGLRGEALIIHGEGTQTRSFCYVDDMMDAFRKLERMPDGFTGPVNLGNDQEITLNQLADALGSVMGRKLERRMMGLPKDDPRRRRPDLSLAKERLGWIAGTNLEEGLRRTIGYFSGLGIGKNQGEQDLKGAKKPGPGSGSS